MRIAIRVLSPHGAPHKWIHGDKHEEVLLLGLCDFFPPQSAPAIVWNNCPATDLILRIM